MPTGEHFRRADMRFGLGYWHWFFLAQPSPLPEQLIGADPTGSSRGPPEPRDPVFAPEALADYLRCYRNPGDDPRHVRGLSGRRDLRLRARRSRSRQRQIAAPLLALWAGRGAVAQWYDVLAIWRDWADDVRGQAIDCRPLHGRRSARRDLRSAARVFHASDAPPRTARAARWPEVVGVDAHALEAPDEISPAVVEQHFLRLRELDVAQQRRRSRRDRRAECRRRRRSGTPRPCRAPSR